MLQRNRLVRHERRAVGSERVFHDGPEAASEGAIDDKVDARVDDHKQLADSGEGVTESARESHVQLLPFALHKGYDAENKFWSFTNDEDDNDNYQNKSGIMFMVQHEPSRTGGTL